MTEQIEITVTPEDADVRLDVFVASRAPGLSRAQAQRLIEDGNVLVGGAPHKANYRLRPGEQITVLIPPPRPTDLRPEDIPLEIVYQDADLLVINKPKGMTTHPAPGSPTGTLVNAVLAQCKDLSGVGGELRPGIVHRLDKNTSGLIVVAKNDQAHLSLQKQISERTAIREYLALVWGDVTFRSAVVDAAIGRHPVHRQRMAVVQETHPGAHRGRPAVTEFHTLEILNGMSLLEARLLTGRTHQVRVHCSFMGHPVVGDPVYDSPRHPLPQHLSKMRQLELQELIENLKGQALHAARLSFRHPRTDEEMRFEAPMQRGMMELVEWMRGHGEVNGER
ncbi:MAG: RluA family pseudouridine synthase [Armatimonadota bacterium]|nr:RluA family pseudouridine synthase [Armatimonadota bacterium]